MCSSDLTATTEIYTLSLHDALPILFNTTINKIRLTESAALRKLRNSMWAKKNILEFARLGYIDLFYLDMFRGWE